MADRSSLHEQRSQPPTTRVLGRSLSEIDDELDRIAAALEPSWRPPFVEPVGLDRSADVLESLERGVDVSSAATGEDLRRHVERVEAPPVATPVVEAPPIATEATAYEGPAAEAGVAIEAARFAPEESPAAVVAEVIVEEPSPTVTVVAPEVISLVESSQEVVPKSEVQGSDEVDASPSADGGSATIDEEPEFELAPTEQDVEPEVPVDSDEVLIVEEAAAAPASTQRTPSVRALEGNDLGELMFELEPDLGVGAPEPQVSAPRLTLTSATSTRPKGPASIPTAPSVRAARPLNPPESLELDLSELLSDVKTPSVRPPPLLRPPPTPQRSMPPPVPRFPKSAPEPDMVELIDEDEIEVVRASSGPPPSIESSAPLPTRTTEKSR